MVESSH